MSIKFDQRLINRRFRDIPNRKERYQIYMGGSSSSKSYSVFTYVPLMAIAGESILVIRANDAHITRSVWSEVNKAIIRLGLSNNFIINKSERSIKCKSSNGCIMFAGVMDPEKLKSITPLSDNSFSLIVCEEASELTEATFNQILLRQRGKSKFKKRVILLLNPIMQTSWIYTRFFKPYENLFDMLDTAWEFVDKELDVYLHKSTYLDNKFLGQEEITTILSMKDISPYHYEVYGLARWGVLGDIIFPNWQEITQKEIPKGLQIKCGIDFGYSDALTFTISMYDRNKREIYVLDGLSYVKLADLRVFADAVKHMLNHWGLSERQLICGDSSDPRSGDVLRTFGLNVQGAIKGAGSKFAGIMFMKTHKLFVLESFYKFKESLRQYTWKKVNGISTDETNHEGSDLIDSVRYGLESEMRMNHTETGRNNKILR